MWIKKTIESRKTKKKKHTHTQRKTEYYIIFLSNKQKYKIKHAKILLY